MKKALLGLVFLTSSLAAHAECVTVTYSNGTTGTACGQSCTTQVTCVQWAANGSCAWSQTNVYCR